MVIIILPWAKKDYNYRLLRQPGGACSCDLVIHPIGGFGDSVPSVNRPIDDRLIGRMGP